MNRSESSVSTSYSPDTKRVERNITPSELAFRIAVAEPDTSSMQAGPYDYYAHEATWGMIMAYDKFVAFF